MPTFEDVISQEEEKTEITPETIVYLVKVPDINGQESFLIRAIAAEWQLARLRGDPETRQPRYWPILSTSLPEEIVSPQSFQAIFPEGSLRKNALTRNEVETHLPNLLSGNNQQLRLSDPPVRFPLAEVEALPPEFAADAERIVAALLRDGRIEPNAALPPGFAAALPAQMVIPIEGIALLLRRDERIALLREPIGFFSRVRIWVMAGFDRNAVREQEERRMGEADRLEIRMMNSNLAIANALLADERVVPRPRDGINPILEMLARDHQRVEPVEPVEPAEPAVEPVEPAVEPAEPAVEPPEDEREGRPGF